MASRVLPARRRIGLLLLALLAALALLGPARVGVGAVKRENFRTCAQSGFCMRQRAYADLVDLVAGAAPAAANATTPSEAAETPDRAAAGAASTDASTAAEGAPDDADGTAPRNSAADGDHAAAAAAAAAADAANPANPAAAAAAEAAAAEAEATVRRLFASPYHVDRASVRVDAAAGTLAALVRDVARDRVYELHVAALAIEMVRVRLREPTPRVPPYAGLEALVLPEGLPPAAPWTDAAFAPDGATWHARFADHSAVTLTLAPFRLQLDYDDVPAIVLNDLGYLYYEHSRAPEDGARSVHAAPLAALMDRQAQAQARLAALAGQDLSAVGVANATAPPPPEAPTPPAAPPAHPMIALLAQLETRLWEETFNGKPDSKPNGPESMGLDLLFPGAAFVYGLPEHASPLRLRSTRGADRHPAYADPYRLYNLDVFEHELDNPMALYGSVPVLMSQAATGVAAGAYWFNAAEHWIDLERRADARVAHVAAEADTATVAHWMVESGEVDVFLFAGATPAELTDRFTRLTGRPQLPQRFSFGYHQCRENYVDQTDAMDVDAAFGEHDMPYDVLWLDLDHTDGRRYFTWDERTFPDPAGLQRHLAAGGRKVVTIQDPHIKREDAYVLSRRAKAADVFVKTPRQEDLEGWCWPGSSNWIDFLNPTGRQVWSEMLHFDNYPGSTPTLYSWIDMNEPSVFTGPEVTFPKDALHIGDVENRAVHNVYGLLQHRATYEGQVARSHATDRPFVLTRAFFAGSQRYGFAWTGDNTGHWSYLAASVPMILTNSYAGMTLVGADVGGFLGNPDVELQTRWFQLAAFQPFFRGHAARTTDRREPYLADAPWAGMIRAALRTRYRLIDWLYSLAEQSHRTGAPLNRAMFHHFAAHMSPAAYGMDDQFLLGDALLIKPVVAPEQAHVTLWVPGLGQAQAWYDYTTGRAVTPPPPPPRRAHGHPMPDTDVVAQWPGLPADDWLAVPTADPAAGIPVLLRGGRILVRRDRERRSSAAMANDPYTLIVALDRLPTAANGGHSDADADADADGDAAGERLLAHGAFYRDDGHSFAYETDGAWDRSHFTASYRPAAAAAASSAVVLRATVTSGAASATATSAARVAPLSIERIVVLCASCGVVEPHPPTPQDVAADPAAAALAAHLVWRRDAEPLIARHAWRVIKNPPGVRMGEPWELTLLF